MITDIHITLITRSMIKSCFVGFQEGIYFLFELFELFSIIFIYSVLPYFSRIGPEMKNITKLKAKKLRIEVHSNM
jgi:hypothetical protein